MPQDQSSYHPIAKTFPRDLFRRDSENRRRWGKGGFVQINDGGCTVGAAVCCTSVRVSIGTIKSPQLLCDHGPEADCASNSEARERDLFSVNPFF